MLAYEHREWGVGRESPAHGDRTLVLPFECRPILLNGVQTCPKNGSVKCQAPRCETGQEVEHGIRAEFELGR